MDATWNGYRHGIATDGAVSPTRLPHWRYFSLFSESEVEMAKSEVGMNTAFTSFGRPWVQFDLQSADHKTPNISDTLPPLRTVVGNISNGIADAKERKSNEMVEKDMALDCSGTLCLEITPPPPPPEFADAPSKEPESTFGPRYSQRQLSRSAGDSAPAKLSDTNLSASASAKKEKKNSDSAEEEDDDDDGDIPPPLPASSPPKIPFSFLRIEPDFPDDDDEMVTDDALTKIASSSSSSTGAKKAFPLPFVASDSDASDSFENSPNEFFSPFENNDDVSFVSNGQLATKSRFMTNTKEKLSPINRLPVPSIDRSGGHVVSSSIDESIKTFLSVACIEEPTYRSVVNQEDGIAEERTKNMKLNSEVIIAKTHCERKGKEGMPRQNVGHTHSKDLGLKVFAVDELESCRMRTTPSLSKLNYAEKYAELRNATRVQPNAEVRIVSDIQSTSFSESDTQCHPLHDGTQFSRSRTAKESYPSTDSYPKITANTTVANKDCDKKIAQLDINIRDKYKPVERFLSKSSSSMSSPKEMTIEKCQSPEDTLQPATFFNRRFSTSNERGPPLRSRFSGSTWSLCGQEQTDHNEYNRNLACKESSFERLEKKLRDEASRRIHTLLMSGGSRQPPSITAPSLPVIAKPKSAAVPLLPRDTRRPPVVNYEMVMPPRFGFRTKYSDFSSFEDGLSRSKATSMEDLNRWGTRSLPRNMEHITRWNVTIFKELDDPQTQSEVASRERTTSFSSSQPSGSLYLETNKHDYKYSNKGDTVPSSMSLPRHKQGLYAKEVGTNSDSLSTTKLETVSGISSNSSSENYRRHFSTASDATLSSTRTVPPSLARQSSAPLDPSNPSHPGLIAHKTTCLSTLPSARLSLPFSSQLTSPSALSGSTALPVSSSSTTPSVPGAKLSTSLSLRGPLEMLLPSSVTSASSTPPMPFTSYGGFHASTPVTSFSHTNSFASTLPLSAPALIVPPFPHKDPSASEEASATGFSVPPYSAVVCVPPAPPLSDPPSAASSVILAHSEPDSPHFTPPRTAKRHSAFYETSEPLTSEATDLEEKGDSGYSELDSSFTYFRISHPPEISTKETGEFREPFTFQSNLSISLSSGGVPTFVNANLSSNSLDPLRDGTWDPASLSSVAKNSLATSDTNIILSSDRSLNSSKETVGRHIDNTLKNQNIHVSRQTSEPRVNGNRSALEGASLEEAPFEEVKHCSTLPVESSNGEKWKKSSNIRNSLERIFDPESNIFYSSSTTNRTGKTIQGGPEILSLRLVTSHEPNSDILSHGPTRNPLTKHSNIMENASTTSTEASRQQTTVIPRVEHQPMRSLDSSFENKNRFYKNSTPLQNEITAKAPHRHQMDSTKSEFLLNGKTSSSGTENKAKIRIPFQPARLLGIDGIADTFSKNVIDSNLRLPYSSIGLQQSDVDKPRLPVDEGKRVVEIEIMKGSLGICFCLEGGKDSPYGDGPVKVKRIFNAGAPDFNVSKEKLHAGDELVSVNGHDLTSATHYAAWKLLRTLPEGIVSLVVQRKT